MTTADNNVTATNDRLKKAKNARRILKKTFVTNAHLSIKYRLVNPTPLLVEYYTSYIYST